MSSMIVLDVTELVGNPIRAGIQRVVRELIRRWPADVPMRVARYEHGEGLVAVSDRVIELITDASQDAASLQPNEISLEVTRLLSVKTPGLPKNGHVFVPEVFFEGRRCAYHQARVRIDPTSVGFIAYDFIPWLHPERIGVKETASLMPYLRLLRSTRRIAFISAATREDYTRRIMRGGGEYGRILPLGCDGLGLEHQTFSPLRRGFLCIGSIDGRKNQDRVLRAFQMLWEQGYDIPLTIVGKAFDNVDLSEFDAARTHPQFAWDREATDERVRELLRKARGTIYASEIEGYGLPPVESLHAGLPVICSGSVASVRDLPPDGQIRLPDMTPEAIAAAVLTLSDDGAAAKLWSEAQGPTLVTWDDFASQTAYWMQSAGSTSNDSFVAHDE
jgi:glycosyltransferase involved in cell wall biosynthesis